VRGGHLSRLGGVSGAREVLVIPSHSSRAERHLDSLEEASSLVHRAWPAAAGFHDAVLMEWPPPDDPARTWRFRPWWESGGFLEESSSNLVLVEEARLLSDEPLNATRLAIDLVAKDFERRRPIEAGQERVFTGLYEAISASKLGGAREGGAVIERNQGSISLLKEPIMGARRWNRVAWRVKVPALLAWIADLAGDGAVDAGLRAFLAEERGGPGTVRGLLDAIGREGGVSLDRVYADYFEGDGLPILTLEDVVFRKRGEGWEVGGAVRNTGSGETRCAVVLRAEGGTVQTNVTIGPGEAAPFSLRSPLPPRTLLLDPLHRCYRYSPRVKVIEQIPFKETP